MFGVFGENLEDRLSGMVKAPDGNNISGRFQGIPEFWSGKCAQIPERDTARVVRLEPVAYHRAARHLHRRFAGPDDVLFNDAGIDPETRVELLVLSFLENAIQDEKADHGNQKARDKGGQRRQTRDFFTY
jgi:hypothetical protein